MESKENERSADDLMKWFLDFQTKQRENRDTDQVKDLYDKWASSYDEDVRLIKSIPGKRFIAEQLSKKTPRKDARILDCGSGTGMLGLEIAKYGFTNIDAMDFSQKSLERAKQKNIYTKFYCGDAHVELSQIPDNSYDVLASYGCFGPGHFTSDIFPEWARIVKPGGFIILSLHESYLELVPEHSGGKFEAVIKHLEQKGKWTQEIIMKFPEYGFGANGIMYTFKIL